MAGNDIGTGPVLVTGCPSVPNVGSEIAEAMVSVCGRMFEEVEMEGDPLHEAGLKREVQRISGHIAVNLTWGLTSATTAAVTTNATGPEIIYFTARPRGTSPDCQSTHVTHPTLDRRFHVPAPGAADRK